MVEDVKGSKSSKVTTETKDMKICDPDGKVYIDLHHNCFFTLIVFAKRVNVL